MDKSPHTPLILPIIAQPLEHLEHHPTLLQATKPLPLTYVNEVKSAKDLTPQKLHLHYTLDL